MTYLGRFGDSSQSAYEWLLLPQHVDLLIDPIFDFGCKFNVEAEDESCQEQSHFMPGEALDIYVSTLPYSKGRLLSDFAQTVLRTIREWLHCIQMIILVLRITKPPLRLKSLRVLEVCRRRECSQGMYVDSDIARYELAVDCHTSGRCSSWKLTWSLRHLVNPRCCWSLRKPTGGYIRSPSWMMACMYSKRARLSKVMSPKLENLPRTSAFNLFRACLLSAWWRK